MKVKSGIRAGNSEGGRSLGTATDGKEKGLVH